MLECHVRREDFTLVVPLDGLDPMQQAALADGEDYIREYNRVLSRWWEQEQESCE